MLLLTDPDHAVPVVVARSGIRLMVYGSGRTDSAARWPTCPCPPTCQPRATSAATSGLGGRFPPGFTIGTVGALRPDDSRAFLEAEVPPAAQLDRGRDVLFLRGYKPVPAADPAAHRHGQRRVVDHAAARGVQQRGAVLHEAARPRR